MVAAVVVVVVVVVTIFLELSLSPSRPLTTTFAISEAADRVGLEVEMEATLVGREKGSGSSLQANVDGAQFTAGPDKLLRRRSLANPSVVVNGKAGALAPGRAKLVTDTGIESVGRG